jgi:hypothetical protein
MGTYSLLQALTVAVLAFLGVIVTLWPPENFRVKLAIALVFGILALLTLKFQQLKENDDAQKTASTQAELLNWQRGETGNPPRVGHPGISADASGNAVMEFIVENPSIFPAYDFNGRLWDVDRLPKDPTSMRDILSRDIASFHISSFAGNVVQFIGKVELAVTENEKTFGAQFTARQGAFSEVINARKINGHWLFALKVNRMDAPGGKEVYREVDPGFPLNAAGDVDWSTARKK